MIFDHSPFVTALDQVIAEVKACEDPVTVIGVLASLKKMAVQIREAVAQVQERYTEIAPKRLEVPGVGLVEVKRGSTRSAWHHEEILARVVAAALDERPADPETGEMLEPEWATVASVLSRCAHIDYWRKGELQKRGIDVDDYCRVEQGPLGVVGV